MDESLLQEVFGDDFERLVGPAYQGYLLPDRFRRYKTPEARFLGPSDAAVVEAFRTACGQEAWEYAGLEEATSYLAAICEGDRIASLAGYRAWGDDAGDPCVLTHPAYRGRGWATATTSAVVGHALDDGKLPLYQTLETNTPAIKIARRLGYEPYARHVAVRLRAETPSNPSLRRPGIARR
jgi:GNAT superfamily N-acetyltransferase